jgi:hypothetical protein
VLYEAQKLVVVRFREERWRIVGLNKKTGPPRPISSQRERERERKKEVMKFEDRRS